MIIFNIDPVPYLRRTQGDKRIMRIPEWNVTTKKTQQRRKQLFRYCRYKDNLLNEARKHGYNISTYLPPITFVIPMPSSWTKKKKEAMNGKAHKQTPDLDNLLKAFKDSLIKNDSIIHTYSGPIKKVWGESGMIKIDCDG